MKRNMMNGAMVGAMILGAVAMAEPTPSASKTGAVTPAAISDAQIAGIVVAANKVDIDAGKLAQSKGKDSQIKQFGEQMANDHKKVNSSAEELVKKLGVKPIDSDTSKALKTTGDATLAKLKKLKGSEFDKAYIESEIAYHQTVIDTIDNTLTPGAQNAELKAALQGFRPAFVAHLDQAKEIKSRLSSGTEPAIGGSGAETEGHNSGGSYPH